MNGFTFFIYISFTIIFSCIFGAITKSINENKGYDGGFAWGFWLGWIGIIVVACRRSAYDQYTPTPSQTYAPASQTPNGWTCRCGRYHSSFVSTCPCGLNKREVLAPPPAAVPQVVTTKKSVPIAPTVSNKPNVAEESKIISVLKEYKDLLDSGVITQEEFDNKKKELLSR